MGDPIADRPLTEPHPSRLSPTRADAPLILELHGAALERGAMTYRDPATGFSVLTAGYLAARGYCCGSGCRHCPYLA
jgi:hypothetical protein